MHSLGGLCVQYVQGDYAELNEFGIETSLWVHFKKSLKTSCEIITFISRCSVLRGHPFNYYGWGGALSPRGFSASIDRHICPLIITCPSTTVIFAPCRTSALFWIILIVFGGSVTQEKYVHSFRAFRGKQIKWCSGLAEIYVCSVCNSETMLSKANQITDSYTQYGL